MIMIMLVMAANGQRTLFDIWHLVKYLHKHTVYQSSDNINLVYVHVWRTLSQSDILDSF